MDHGPFLGRASLGALVGVIVPALAPSALAQVGQVLMVEKVSANSGGFGSGLANEDVFGRALTRIGDLNGDGRAEYAVGAPGDSEGGWRRGAVWVLFPNADGSVQSRVKINDLHGGFGGALSDGDLFGRSLTTIGDLDLDGIPDLAVGAPHDDGQGPTVFKERGAVWILFLNANGTVRTQSKISAGLGGFSGQLDVGDQFGFALAPIGDLNGDGRLDLAVGANFDDDGGAAGTNVDLGAVWILFLNFDGTVFAHKKISSTVGGWSGQRDFQSRAVGLGGDALASLGDLNGDGRPELAVGAIGGRSLQDFVWILSLNASGHVHSYSSIAAGYGGFGGILYEGDAFGSALAAVGDLDRDGVVDLAIGAPGADDGFADAGAVWIAFLNGDGSVSAQQKISRTSGNLGPHLAAGDRFGSALAGVGDLNGDAAEDLVVGTPLDDDGGDRRGAAYVLNLVRANGAPRFVPPLMCASIVDAHVGQSVTFNVTATDDDAGDMVTLGLMSMPSGATALPGVSHSGNPATLTFDWVPGSLDVGSHAVQFTATDALGGSVSCSLTLNVNPPVVAEGICGDATPYHRRKPGSLLLFPEWDDREGAATFLTITNTNCDFDSQGVFVEARYISRRTCNKQDRTYHLTPCDTLTLLTSTQAVGPQGYVYVYAKNQNSTPANSNGEPIAWNWLIGQEIVVDGYLQRTYGINAVSFQAFLNDGDVTDFDQDGIRDLDGAEYSPAPDEILVPRFLGQWTPFDGVDDIAPFLAPLNDELILIALSGGRAFTATQAFPFLGTTVDFLIYNDNEQPFSAEHTFSCWDKVPLLEVSNAFSNTFLLTTDHDPSEIQLAGPGTAPEAGWFRMDGGVANSIADAILDPAVYAVLVQHQPSEFDSAADLPFELCSQFNGDLLPISILGDSPTQVGDNE